MFHTTGTAKKCDFIGFFIDSVITSEIMRVRNKNWADPNNFGNNIREKIRGNNVS